ncbi:MAG: HD domain-containing phosphohydrolase [bacterium]
MEETKTILIIDDSQENLSVLERLITHLGYQADLCRDGLEAIERAGQRSYEMIFTDVNMPRMNGIEFLQSIRSKGDTTPVVMITGFPSITLAVESMKKGASDFITKPFQMGHIEHIITRTLREKSLQQKNRYLEGELRNKKKIEELNENLQSKIEELSIMYSTGEMACHSENMEDLFDRMIEMASSITKGEDISILIIDRETDALVPKRLHGDGNLIHPIPLREGAIGKAVLENRTLMIPAGKLSPISAAGKTNSNFLALPMAIKDEVFGSLNISKASPFSAKELHLLNNMLSKFTMAIENHALYESIYENLTDTLRSLVMAVEAKDLYTKDHSQRVTDLAILIANEMGRSRAEMETLRFSGFIHDIGKIGIQDTILLKPGSLTDTEWESIRTHPVIGENIVKPLKFLHEERLIIRHHHERFDGTGYPDGIKGEEIPLLARILAVADTYDAMTSSRPYRTAKGHDFAVEEIIRSRNTQLDPLAADAFLACVRSYGMQKAADRIPWHKISAVVQSIF